MMYVVLSMAAWMWLSEVRQIEIYFLENKRMNAIHKKIGNVVHRRQHALDQNETEVQIIVFFW